jgi:hypothetical protein
MPIGMNHNRINGSVSRTSRLFQQLGNFGVKDIFVFGQLGHYCYVLAAKIAKIPLFFAARQ